MGSRILGGRLQWRFLRDLRKSEMIEIRQTGCCFEQQMNSRTDTVRMVFWLEEKMEMTGGQEENQRSRGLEAGAKQGGTSQRKHH